MDEDDINDLIGTLNQGSKIDDNILEKARSSIKDAIAKIRKVFPDATAGQFKSATGAAIKQLAADLSADNPDISKAVATFASSVSKSLKSAISDIASDIFGPEFSQSVEKSAVEASSALSGAFKKVAEGAGIVVPVDFDMSKASSLGGLLMGMKDVGEVGAGFALAKGFDAAESSIAVVNRKATELLGNLADYRAAAGEISKIQVNPFESSVDIANSANAAGREAAFDFEKEFAKTAINLRARLGISGEQAAAELRAVYSGLENYGAQLKGIEIKAKIGGTDTVISGAEAIAMAARATGIDISTMTKTINNLTFTMGANGKQAVQSIETIAKAAANTLLPVSKFHTEVMAAAGKFELFGDNTEEAAAMLDRFISKAAPNRIGASVQAFQSVTAGIAGMTDQMKAFIGMGTELAGGGGAIESIVRLDAALQSGDKDALQGIFDEAIARIEELTGAPVMTLEEAVSSGQEQTFYQQVKMLEEMNLGKGSAQASDIFAASKRGAIDVETIRAQGGPGLGAMAVEKAQFGRGALDIAKEMAGAGADLERFNAAYAEGSVKVMETSKNLAAGFLNLGNAVAGTEKFVKALEAFGQPKGPVTTKPLESKRAEEEDAAIAASGATAREIRAATRGAQDALAKELNAGLDATQTMVAEELTRTATDTQKTVKAESDRVIATLSGAGAGGSSATGTGLGALDAAAKEISAAATKIADLKLQIELKGEARDWIKAAAVEAFREDFKKASGIIK